MTHRITPSRRALLQGLAAFGAAAPLALNLAAVGKAAAQSAGPGSGYRALVCVFLQGGNDAHNMLLATDPGSFAQYTTARSSGSEPINLMPAGTAPVAIGGVSPVTKRTIATTDMPEHWGGVLPITPATAQLVPPANATTSQPTTRTFAVHPFLTGVQGLFAAGRLAAVANVGTLLAPLTKADYQKPGPTTQIPQRLFSHSDQQSAWQSGQVDGSATGWGGLMADTFQALGGGETDFSAITTAGNTAFLNGQTARSFRINYAANKATAQTITLTATTGRYNSSNDFLDELRASLVETNLSPGQSSDMVADYAAAVGRSIALSAVFDNALTGAAAAEAAIPNPPAFTDPIGGKVVDNPLADQLQAVVETAAAQAQLGVQRQVFFVQLGGFDTHDGENPRQGLLMAQLDHALSYFDAAIAAAGMADKITAFTASDFNRTFATNGTGTDHAWGSHHFVLGAAVKGGDLYGPYPTVGIDKAASGSTPAFTNPDAASNAYIPTTSVETYLATLATWMGVTPAQMPGIFPRLAGFPVQNMGFMRT
ncbi:DUF1501 domain-containing protein [Phenylobacterium sp.]|uniref:DUF1501 domain-containing protein n=1 Tax=Phenylobacterium sp. TaxID=1871053 RepID=UPI002CF1DE0A|nr:DUF1501 domain-containing protein [Phenylobacterium sp.]HLZ74930.1 DUF1501 domain-containing protein [Phenylobacterium sp.]